MWTRFQQWCKTNYGLGVVLLLAAVLLLFRVSARTFWMDETMVLSYLHLSPVDFLKDYWAHPDNHPPLYYFLVLLVSKILPWTELTIRLVSILSGLGIVAVVYVFSQRVFASKPWALVAAGFTALSSYFVLISQMARYHSLAGLVSLLSLYFFYQFYVEKKSRAWVYYLIFFIIAGLADYPHFIYLGLITNAVYVVTWLRRRPLMSLPKWIGGQAIVALTFLPMVWLLYHRIFIQGDGGFNNLNLLANSWVHIVAGILFHVYTFLFGENILPWNYGWFVAGVVVLLGVLWGLLKICRQPERGGARFVAGLALGLMVVNTLFMNFANPRYNFTVYPKFGFVAYPLCIIAFVAGLRAIQSKKIQLTLFTLWTAVTVFGLFNFYNRTNYLNPSYFNTFTGVEHIRDHAKSGQYLAITPDAGLGLYEFYKQKYFSQLKPLMWAEIPVAPTGSEVWFLATGSDAPDRSVDPAEVVPAGYRIIERLDSVPLDSDFKKFKERFLHRPSYTFKYSVFLLEKL